MIRIDRREFLKLIGTGGVGVGAGFALSESIKHPVEYLIPEVVPPEEFSAGIDTWYHSVCTLCPAGCGIAVRTREGRAKKIEGNPNHPVNQGRLCALGQAGLQQLYNPDRLTEPLIRTGARGSGAFAPISWEEGFTKVVQPLRQLRNESERKKPSNRVALLSEGVSGHLSQLFERFMALLDSELLWHYDFAHPHSLYAANQLFFSEQRLPYYDLKNTRYLLSFGADYLGTWLSPVHYSLGYGHSRQGTGNRSHCVQIEPRMSLSGAAADEWIAVPPGSEGILALGLAHRIVAAGHYQGADLERWANALTPYHPAKVAEITEVPAEQITRLADDFVRMQPGLAIGGDSVGNQSNGVNSLIAINALNYLVGNIGKTGGLIFNPAPAAPTEPALTTHHHQASYRDLQAFAERARAGTVDLLILHNANPLFTLPAVAEFQQTLDAIPLVVSLSSFMDETTAQADIILPGHTYLESWGDHLPEPGVGFPVGALSQPVVSPLYNTRATGDIVLELAHQLGFDEVFPARTMEAYLKQAMQQGWRQRYAGTDQTRQVSESDFEAFWCSVLKAGVWGEKTTQVPKTFTPDPAVIDQLTIPKPEFAGDRKTYPLLLHPYRSTHFHDGRGANLPWLQELPDAMTSVVYGTWVEINPVTAEQLGLHEGDLVQITSPHGTLMAPVSLYPAIRPEVVAMPIGQGHSQYGRYAQGRGTNPLRILAPQLQAHSDDLAWGATRVRVEATGQTTTLIKTGGLSRQLGREIVQTSFQPTRSLNRDNLIPTKQVP